MPALSCAANERRNSIVGKCRRWKEGGHGKIDLMDAIIESSNTFFFSLAYKSEIDDLVDHLSYFGFGRNVCIDCFIPDNGLLPNPEWNIRINGCAVCAPTHVPLSPFCLVQSHLSPSGVSSN